jgi:hypothetical protein
MTAYPVGATGLCNVGCQADGVGFPQGLGGAEALGFGAALPGDLHQVPLLGADSDVGNDADDAAGADEGEEADLGGRQRKKE